MRSGNAESAAMQVWRMRLSGLEADLRKLTAEIDALGASTPSEELDERASKLRFAIEQLMRECPDPAIRQRAVVPPVNRRELLVKQVRLLEKMVELSEKAKEFQDAGKPRPDWLERDIDNYYGQLEEVFEALGQKSPGRKL